MMANVLFILRTYNDTDHIVPIIWKTLENGDRAFIAFVEPYDYENDYRLNFLRNKYEYQIYQFPWAHRLTKPNRLVLKLVREIFCNDVSCSLFLKRHKISSCVFEFGNSYGRDLRGHLFSAAKRMGIPTFCVPHGCMIYLNYDINDHIREIKHKTGKWPDFSDRSHFDFYVVQSPFHRKQSIDWGQDPNKTFAWGSARFYPKWAEKNLEICPPFFANKNDRDRIRVVFMLPHWDYNVNKNKSLDLIFELAAKTWIYLVVKDHTRGSGGLSLKLAKELNMMPNVEAKVEENSPALIKWSDVVINFGSSIGVEALLMDKELVNPVYLHTNETIFERTGACHIAESASQVVTLLRRIREGIISEVPESNKYALFREVIYGGKEEHDVLDYYWRKITLRKVPQ